MSPGGFVETVKSLQDLFLLDLEKRYSKYIPPEGHPPFLKLGGLYERNFLKPPEWSISTNGGLGGQTPNSYLKASVTNSYPGKFEAGDLVLCLSDPTMEEPFQRVLKMKDATIQVIYSVQGMMAYWNLVSEPTFPGAQTTEAVEEKEAPPRGPVYF